MRRAAGNPCSNTRYHIAERSPRSQRPLCLSTLITIVPQPECERRGPPLRHSHAHSPYHPSCPNPNCQRGSVPQHPSPQPRTSHPSSTCPSKHTGAAMSDYPLAYFITWRTYGSWLPGDPRGWLKNRKGFQPPNPDLHVRALLACREPPLVLYSAAAGSCRGNDSATLQDSSLAIACQAVLEQPRTCRRISTHRPRYGHESVEGLVHTTTS